MDRPIAASFEQAFLSMTLAKQIADCDSYELAPLFLELFAQSQPVLEAGCGSGRWCGWLHAHGIASDGIDCSAALCERARREFPDCRFYAGDMTESSLPSGTYDGLLVLGSVEHALDGPEKALAEFHRLLRPGALAVVTVPYGGRLRLALRAMANPFEAAKGVAFLRRLAGKPPLLPNAHTLRAARRDAVGAWHPRYTLGPDGWSFYEYQFTCRQFDAFINRSGLVIVRRFITFLEEGLLHSFGRLVGRWNGDQAHVDLTPIGRLLRGVLPVSVAGHMLCYVLEKRR